MSLKCRLTITLGGGVAAGVAMALFLSANPSRVIFVDPSSGSDTNQRGRPAQTLGRALALARSGDRIRLGRGTYEISRPISFVASDVSIVGSGVGRTILKNTQRLLNGTMIYALGNNIEVSDLTVDGNRTILTSPLQSISAIAIYGNNAKIRRVLATNFHGGRAEAFVLVIFSSVKTGNLTGAMIDHCKVNNFSGNGTMIHIGSDNPATKVTGVVKDNFVHGCEGSGIGCGGAVNSEFSRNLVDGAENGLNRDTFVSWGNKIVHNSFLRCRRMGINWRVDNDTAADDGLEIAWNTVSLSTSALPDRVGINVVGAPLTRAKVHNNSVSGPDGSNQNGYNIVGGDEVTAYHNRCSDHLLNKFVLFGAGSKTRLIDNLTFGGGPMRLRP